MVITKSAAALLVGEGLGSSATTGTPDLVQYLHHQWVDRLGDLLLERGVRL
jgi:hypothetical protein